VLNTLSEQIRDCLEHADECARSAKAQNNSGLRDDFLRLEKLWRELAQSMETDSLSLPNNSPTANRRPNKIVSV
jgi:hypothetical protein